MEMSRLEKQRYYNVSIKMHGFKGIRQVDPSLIDILGISESFLTSNDLDVRIKIDGYHQPERRDRSGKRGGGGGGGGLLAYVSTALNYVRRCDLECDDLELLWTEIMPSSCTSFLVCFNYIPKTMIQTDREIVSNIENSLCLGSDMYVLGNVNVDLMKGTHYALYNDLVMLRSDQLICEVTRPGSNSCLDHVYVNNPSNVMTSVAFIGLSDHCPVSAVGKRNGSFAKSNMKITIRYRDLKKNVDELRFTEQLSNAPRSVIDITDDVDVQLHLFEQLYFSVLNEYAPIVERRVKAIKQPPWFNGYLFILMVIERLFDRLTT